MEYDSIEIVHKYRYVEGDQLLREMRSPQKTRLASGTSLSVAQRPLYRSLVMVVNGLLIFGIAAWTCERNHRREASDSRSTRAQAIITAWLSAFTDTANRNVRLKISFVFYCEKETTMFKCAAVHSKNNKEAMKPRMPPRSTVANIAIASGSA